jgi:hypothetical protein
MKVLKLIKTQLGILQTMFTLQTMVTHCFEQQNRWIHLIAYIWMTFEFRAFCILDFVIQFDFTLQFWIESIWIESHYTNHLDWGHHTCFGLDFVDALNKLFASNYAPNVYWPSMIGNLFSWALLMCHMFVICLHRIYIWGVVTSHVVASNSRICKMFSMFISSHPNNMLCNMQQQVIVKNHCNVQFYSPMKLTKHFFQNPKCIFYWTLLFRQKHG